MATTESSASTAHESSTPLDRILDRIEEELARLRRKRPALEETLGRAERILVTHFAVKSNRGTQLIRVRIGLDGRAKFLFSSLRDRGATYVINPSIWACTCPAYHRRGGPCKHSLAAYGLWQAGQPEARRRTCDNCHERFPRRALVEVLDEYLCRSCADAASVL